MKESLVEQFGNIQSWADIYDSCEQETKKMILSKMFSEVRVRRDYEVEIDLTTSCEQLGLYLEEPDAGKAQQEQAVKEAEIIKPTGA